MLATKNVYQELLACPRCRSPLAEAPGGLLCTDNETCGKSFTGAGSAGQWPVLVDFANSVLSAEHVAPDQSASLVNRDHGLVVSALKKVVKPSNRVAAAHAALLLGTCAASADRPLVLVVGGGSVGNGMAELYQDPRVDVLGFDIYPSPHVQLVADAHSIPLAGASVDAVVVQAVLEHVLDPWQVVSEIFRVLKPGGLVYSETPFLQNVHEGPWDFTRFTESGHRYLFRDFELLDSGWVAGLGTQAYWSIAQLWRGLARHRLGGTAARVCFFWLPRLDGLAGAGWTIDGASCVFFYGRKATSRLTAAEAVSHYQGAQ